MGSTESMVWPPAIGMPAAFLAEGVGEAGVVGRVRGGPAQLVVKA